MPGNILDTLQGTFTQVISSESHDFEDDLQSTAKKGDRTERVKSHIQGRTKQSAELG